MSSDEDYIPSSPSVASEDYIPSSPSVASEENNIDRREEHEAPQSSSDVDNPSSPSAVASEENNTDRRDEHEAPQQPNASIEPSRGRKRPRDEKNWKKNVRKQLRNQGKSYRSSSTGAIVPDKTFPLNFDCHCKRRCCEKIGNDVGKSLFESFWGLGDLSKQNVYLRGLVQLKKPDRSRKRCGGGTPKSVIYIYNFRLTNNTVSVCKKYFLAILQISWGRLYRCLSKEEFSAVTDARGRHTPANKLDISGIMEHIKSFPAYRSHYSRKDNPNRKYLHPDLTIRKMYQMYVEKCNSESQVPLKEKLYYKVFSTKFNLHFKHPSTDTCKLCDELQMQIVNENDESRKQALIAKKELHLRKAEQARNSLKSDKEKASADIYTCTFDLQKALPFPKISTSVAYYKRNMYIYNFGVHSFNENTGYMYTWDEVQGGRGSQDISSMVRKHVIDNAATHKHIIMYSDACTGQNRNIKMALTLLKLVQTNEIESNVIDHKFLISGHSFLPNDSQFGIIEVRGQKKENIYSPADWVDIIKNAKKKPPTFKVFELKHTDFLSTKSLEESITNRKKDIHNQPINWLHIRWLRVERGEPFILKFKETLNEDIPFRQIDLKKSGRGRNLLSLANVVQSPLYSGPRKIAANKKRDMMDLLPYIPPIHHSYFKNLPVDTNTRSNNTVPEEVGTDEFFYDN